MAEKDLKNIVGRTRLSFESLMSFGSFTSFICL